GVGPIAPVVSGGVGWYPSSSADRPGLLSPLKSAAEEGVIAAGGELMPPLAAAALSLALRRADGFNPRNCLAWLPGGRLYLPGMRSLAWAWPTGPMAPLSGAATTVVAGTASKAPANSASAANRRDTPVRPTKYSQRYLRAK